MLDGCTPWPADVAVRYRDHGHWSGETLADLPVQWSRRYGNRTALVSGRRSITYNELELQIRRMAAGFREHGLCAGDRVVVQLPNTPEFVIVVFALISIDVKPVFALPAHRATEIRHLLTMTDAAGYVVPDHSHGFDHAALARALAAEFPALRLFVHGTQIPDKAIALNEVDAEPAPLPTLDPSDVAFFLLSGGTTALPKLIPRTHNDYAYQTRAAAAVTGLTRRDVYLAALPAAFNFTFGCPGIIGTLRVGGTVVLIEDPIPADCFELIEQHRVTVTALVPALVQLWLDAVEDNPYDLGSLGTVQVGGAPLHHDIATRIGPSFGVRLQQVFGMAEGLITMTRDTDPPEAVLTTQGRPLSPDDEIRIVGDDGIDLPPGVTGELLVRGPYTLRGYYKAAVHNASAFTDDGFYRTGDLAHLTTSGHLVVQGRRKDVIIRGGNKVSASEIEGYLLAHPAVDQVAVVPVPDPYVGERICAYVRAAGTPPTLPELRKALQERGIADYKLPDRLELITDLPLTALGKLDKKALAAAAAKSA
ncbi:(2,3-dihydroxybenzoyl)adenylate synthase [Nocardia barduliensis]|uniref:(2,3-dihydroxybenzoyl)adenylate synthase n=1 Tax=Nocardia barduliensis TaxID=2736643 RepID=UPI001572272F|nr:AMP-binding protein [Nocardia barduliensis]